MGTTRNVKDLMNPDIMTVADDMTTDALARYLIEREISGAPVVDSQGHLIGVVSMTDIGRNMAEPSDVESSRSSDFYRDVAADLTLEDLGQRYVEERAVTVRDVMTPVIHQVPVTASVAEAVMGWLLPLVMMMLLWTGRSGNWRLTRTPARRTSCATGAASWGRWLDA